MKPLQKAGIITVIAVIVFVFGYIKNSLVLLLLTALLAIIGLDYVKKAGGFFASTRKRR